jgi:hypothetical protein
MEESKEVAEHKGSRVLKDTICQWEPGPLIFSSYCKWARWGLLGVLSEYVLSVVKGSIIEIGVGESSLYFTELAKKYNRKIYHCDYSVGKVINYKSVPGYFKDEESIFRMTSDQFFESITPTDVALGFIDGNHLYDYVKRDFENIFKFLVDNGYIFLHDTYPMNEEYTSEHRCGTGYILRQELEKDPRVDCFTFLNTAWDVGLTMVRKKSKNLPYYQE